MMMIIPIGQGLALKFTTNPENQPGFPTARLQKGFLLLDEEQDLAEEGVGFGVPVLMRGLKTIFPGGIQLSASDEGPHKVVRAIYTLNLEEKMGKPTFGGIESKLVYAVKNYLAALIRKIPTIRGLLTGISNGLRKICGWETLYEPSEFTTDVRMTYTIDQLAGILGVTVDTLDLNASGVTEVIVMNELGARNFDQYIDSSGSSLQGKEIGCWDETAAKEASFISNSHGVTFTLMQVSGAKLYRGREIIGSRLAWAGFGYSFPPALGCFRYQVKIGRIG
jgi:hypothetical protein